MIDERFILSHIKILLPVYDMVDDIIIVGATTQNYAFNLLLYVQDADHIVFINAYNILPDISHEPPKSFQIAGWEYMSNIDVTGQHMPLHPYYS